jgi:hypothetical protein
MRELSSRPSPWRRAVAVLPLLAALVGATVLGTATSAVADPLPVGTFKIQSNDLRCISTWSQYHSVLLESCNTVDLQQQFTYQPTTQQIVSVGRVGNCIELVSAGPFGGRFVYWQTCSSSNAWQKFEREGPDAFGRYTIRAVNLDIGGVQCLDSSYQLGVGTLCSGEDYLWRFPLV